MYQIQNKDLTVTMSSDGAEITSVRHNTLNLEYIWNADEKYWKRHTPLLFPMVGSTPDHTYYYEGKEYHIPHHGFARDMKFETTLIQPQTIIFTLCSNEKTLEMFPFDFELRVTYALQGSALQVRWDVFNKTQGRMYFSIGAHPAFSTRLLPGDETEAPVVVFQDNHVVKTRLVDPPTGFVFSDFETISEDAAVCITKALFGRYQTLVVQNESKISLNSVKHSHGVDVTFHGFPYVGLWSPVVGDELAPFLCIEPWHGLGSTSTTPQDVTEREGILLLEQDGEFHTQYELSFR